MPTEVLVQSVRERGRSLLWWTLGIVGLVGVTVAFYPSIRGDAGLSNFGEDLPESLRALFVGGELDLASPVGYLNSQIYAALAPLLFLVFSIGAGAGAVAGEEERGALDLLLAEPVRRRDYVVQRFLALAALVAGLAVVLLATVALGSALVDLDIGFDKLLAASVSVALLAVLFGAVALAVGAIRPGRAAAIAAAAGLAVAAWLLDGLGQAVDALDPVRPLSPFYQALGRNPLRDGVPWTGWAVLLVGTLLLVVVAAVGLERRDVRQ
jgi:ABC-2 type transport system permease protein